MSNTFPQYVPPFTGSLLNSFTAQEILNHHNMARQEVDVAPLAWSVKLSNYAQDWADYLSIHNHCTMKHSNCKDNEGNSLGEDLWWGSSSSFYKPLDSSIGWLSEKNDYLYQPFGKPTSQPIVHYTQMVWKNTTQMIKWMFIFWMGQVAVSVGLIMVT